jgi:hypothetical protein
MDKNELQVQFFKHIKNQLPSNISFVDDIADLLNISNDSAYRRIRGEKTISFEELQKLSMHYNISLDQMMHINSNSIVFQGNNVEPGNFDFEKYLQDMLNILKALNAATQKHMIYEAKDMPLFYFFQYPELASFKFFFWMKSVLSYPEYAKMKFEDNELMKVLIKLGSDIIKNYCTIPSTEIWVAESISTTIRQIEYYTEGGVFRNKETIELLYNQLEKVIEHVKEQAECGEKFLIGAKPCGKPDNYHMYFNEVFLGHNTLILEADQMEVAVLNHGVLNFMRTYDKKFFAYTKKQLENTMKKSVLISSVGEKERNRFFNTVFQKISTSKKEALSKFGQ